MFKSVVSDISFIEKHKALKNSAIINVFRSIANIIINKYIVLNIFANIVHLLVPILSINIFAGICKMTINKA